jgi:hypothetical protein
MKSVTKVKSVAASILAGMPRREGFLNLTHVLVGISRLVCTGMVRRLLVMFIVSLLRLSFLTLYTYRKSTIRRASRNGTTQLTIWSGEQPQATIFMLRRLGCTGAEQVHASLLKEASG